MWAIDEVNSMALNEEEAEVSVWVVYPVFICWKKTLKCNWWVNTLIIMWKNLIFCGLDLNGA